MAFSFLAPSALWLLAGLPLLLLPYLLRERGKKVIVPALFLYQGLPSASPVRLWGRLKLTPLFFLQLLILLLLGLSVARPLLRREAELTGIILDNSASMQARLPGGESPVLSSVEGTVFEEAKRQALKLIRDRDRDREGLSLSDISVFPERVGVFVTSPLPTPVVAPLLPQSNIEQEVSRLVPTDTPDPGDEVLAGFIHQLLTEQKYQRLFFFTDRVWETQPEKGPLTVISLGQPQANLAITAFRLYRSPFFPEEVDATVVVTGQARDLTPPSDEGSSPIEDTTVTIEDATSGKRLLSQSSRSIFSFPRLPIARAYRARLEPEDALALDNEAYAVLPPLKEVPVLVVTPSPQMAATLRQIPNLSLQLLSPEDYDPEQVSPFPLILFHLTAPATLPNTNAAFILPPEGNALFPLGRAARHPQVTQWVSGHPLTSYITFSLLSPAYGQAFLPVVWCRPVITATVGPLVLAGEREGKRYAALGFDLFPYLGKRNLPASIFTLNLLNWLMGREGHPPALRTGEVFSFAATTLSVRTPAGEVISAERGTFPLLWQGVYTIEEKDGEKTMAVNLSNPQESRLSRPLRLAPLPTVSGSPPEIASPSTELGTGLPLWPFLLLTAFALLSLEWYLHSRQREAPA